MRSIALVDPANKCEIVDIHQRHAQIDRAFIKEKRGRPRSSPWRLCFIEEAP
jgi:hypothetical protein